MLLEVKAVLRKGHESKPVPLLEPHLYPQETAMHPSGPCAPRRAAWLTSLLYTFFPLGQRKKKPRKHHPGEQESETSSLRAAQTMAQLDQFLFNENLLQKDLQVCQAPGLKGRRSPLMQGAAFSPPQRFFQTWDKKTLNRLLLITYSFPSLAPAGTLSHQPPPIIEAKGNMNITKKLCIKIVVCSSQHLAETLSKKIDAPEMPINWLITWSTNGPSKVTYYPRESELKL